MNFESLYRQKLLVHLLELEKSRKKIKRQLLLLVFVFMGLIGIALQAALLTPEHVFISVIAGGLIVFLYFIICSKDYKKNYKKNIIEKLLSDQLDQLNYHPSRSLEESLVEKSRLVAHFTQFSGEDLIEARVGKRSLRLSQLKLGKYVQNGKNRRRVTVFQGLFVQHLLPTSCPATIFLMNDLWKNSLGDYLGDILQDTFSSRGERVELESPEFESFFQVYSDDPFLTRKIFSPAAMNLIVRFRKTIGIPLSLLVQQKQILMALESNHDFFDPPIFRSVLNPRRLEKLTTLIDLLTKLPEDLRLEDKLAD